jgi:hypothetical protein
MNSTLSWPIIKARLKEAVLVLPHFGRNPVQFMRNLPPWEWPEMLILQAIFAAACAVLTSAVARNFLGVITGIVVGPVTQLLIVSISAGFFFYLFMFYFHREVPYRQIYIHLMFAAIPAMLCNILAPVIPPATLIGIVGTAMLLFVGFVSNFHLDRMKVRNILGGLVLIYIVCWAVQMVTFSNKHERLREKATPESLDILEKELNIDN